VVRFITGKSLLYLSESKLTIQDEPYKFTVIGKDLQDVSLSTADFLVHDGQMTFISNDKEGVLRLVDFDPAGMSHLIFLQRRS
jgi:DNA polymerase III sliding clamp (beta) subunit (PCNA family)